MRIKKLFLSIAAVCTIGLLLPACGRNERYSEETIDKALNVAIYAATVTNGEISPVDPALLQEKVSLDKIFHYERDGAFITVPFHFSDTTEYAKITESHIGKRIVISIDGEIVATPIVKMPITDGACSVLLSKEQALKLVPKEKVEKLLIETN